MVLGILAVVLLLICVVVGVVGIYFRYMCASKRTKRFSVGFFHPYCNAGGGGERVLWCAILALQQKYKDVSILVYTGDDVQAQAMIAKVKTHFGIEFPHPDYIDFVHLTTRKWVEAERYPHFTMIGQSLGSIYMGLEAISLTTPHVMLDTMGYAFTYPLFRLIGGCKVGCYVHYPTISSDMLTAVADQREAVNNRGGTTSAYKRYLKLIYYRLFALSYKIVGKFSQVVMVNSSWTAGHISSIWGTQVQIVYPPCDTTRFTALPLNWKGRIPVILSIAQFRPEKDHKKQIRALQSLFQKYPQHKSNNVKLVLVGSARNEGDKKRIEELKSLSVQLGVASNVQFEVDASLERLTHLFSTSMVGIHTMWNEHFGIGVVELSAAGVIPVAHNSAGPKLDIVKHGETGFLAEEAEEYAEYINKILREPHKHGGMQQAGRVHVEKFSQEKFMEAWNVHTQVFMKR